MILWWCCSLQFPVREASLRALGRLLLHQVQSDPSNSSAHSETLSSIVLAMQDDSSEVRRRALSSLKAVAKVCLWPFDLLYNIISLLYFWPIKLSNIYGRLILPQLQFMLQFSVLYLLSVWRTEVHLWDWLQRGVLCMPSN